jgi:hypothetical protein
VITNHPDDMRMEIYWDAEATKEWKSRDYLAFELRRCGTCGFQIPLTPSEVAVLAAERGTKGAAKGATKVPTGGPIEVAKEG